MRFDLTISEFTRTLAAGEELVVYDADTWRPYCHVSDISKAVMTVFDAPAELSPARSSTSATPTRTTRSGWSSTSSRRRSAAPAKVTFEEGGRDPRNYRVSFEKIRERLGYEPDFRVPISVAAVAEAVQAGAFVDYAERLGFYTNHAISPRVLDAHLAEGARADARGHPRGWTGDAPGAHTRRSCRSRWSRSATGRSSS